RQALAVQMLHQSEKEGQIAGGDPLFIEGQDKGSGLGMNQEVGIFRSLGNALIGEKLSHLIGLQKFRQLDFVDVSVNGHHDLPFRKAISTGRSETSRKARMTGNSSVSSAVAANSTLTSKRVRKASM